MAPTRHELFATAEPLLVTTARAVGLTPRSRDWADLLQELALQLWRCTERFDPKRGVPFRGFAVWVLRGAARNFLEAQARPEHREYIEDHDTQPDGCASDSAAAESMDRATINHLVRIVADHAVSKMTPALAEAARCTILNDEAAASVAARTGRSRLAIYQSRTKAMRALAATFEEFFNDSTL